MEKKFKLGIIGAGFMASSIMKGVISSKNLAPENIIMSDPSCDALNRVKQHGVSTTDDNLYLCNESEYVLFAVKPQSFPEVIKQIKDCSARKFLSIMAGVKMSKISSNFKGSFVARCMPNTPCSIGSGAIGIDLSEYKDERDKNFIKSVFTSLGEVVEIPEFKMNAVTGVSGSSPAYFYLFIKGIIDAGIKAGLNEIEAKSLAVNTMIGSGKMILSNPDKSIDELISAVCSKGGTTIEAVKVYTEGGLSSLTENAVNACIERSRELENI